MKKYLLVLFIGLSLIFFAQGGMILYKAHNSAKWPAVAGTIVSSKVSHHLGGKGAPYSSPDITYSYKVGPTIYVNDNIAYAPLSSSTENKVRSVTGRYPAGRQVAVHYDTADPQESVLEPGVTDDSWTKVLAGILFLIISGGIAIFPNINIKKKVSVNIKVKNHN